MTLEIVLKVRLKYSYNIIIFTGYPKMLKHAINGVSGSEKKMAVIGRYS